MPIFLLSHRHPKNYTGTADTAAAWTAWFEKMGASVVDLGNPVFDRTTVGNCGPDTDLGGYTLITADDFDGAVALARGCPLLPDGGGVEVGELRSVPGRHHPARVF